MSTTQMTTEHENTVLKDALFGRFGIVSGLNLIEACLAKASKADHGDAPAALDHNESKLWHRAQQEAYRHVLEMVSVPTEVRALEHSMPVAKSSAVVEFPDWRAAEGFEDPVSPAASGNGRLEIAGGGWGAALIGKTPSGREFKIHFEFDADTPKFAVYPPSSETGLASSDEPVLHAAVLDDGVLVSTGYGPTSALYHPQGILEEAAPFSGAEAMERTRHPLYGLYKSVVLEELGYEFQEDSDQAGMWIWTAPTDNCPISFHSPKEAVDNAWDDAKQQAMAIAGLSEEEWESKHFDDKVDFLRQTLGSDDAAPAPR